MAFFDVKAFTPKIIKDLFLKAWSLKVWKSESCSNGFLQKEMAEAFSLSLHEHFARKENHSIESLYQSFDVKIEYLQSPLDILQLVWLWSCQGLGVSSGGAYLDQHQQGRCCPAQPSSSSLLGGVRRCWLLPPPLPCHQPLSALSSM